MAGTPKDWAMTSFVLAIIAIIALIILDRALGKTILDVGTGIFLILLFIGLFVIMRTLRFLKSGEQLTFQTFFIIGLVIAAIAFIFWKYPNIAPNFSILFRGGP